MKKKMAAALRVTQLLACLPGYAYILPKYFYQKITLDTNVPMNREPHTFKARVHS